MSRKVKVGVGPTACRLEQETDCASCIDLRVKVLGADSLKKAPRTYCTESRWYPKQALLMSFEDTSSRPMAVVCH